MNNPRAIGILKKSRGTRGTVLIAVTWLLIILTALALVMSQTMRVDLQITANAQSQAQADAAERGAEQLVLSQIDGLTVGQTFKGDAASITTQVNCEAQPVGSGYFWILSPNPTDPSQYLFAITDESGKLNLNTATQAMLALLPGMSDNANSLIPASIVGWRGNGQPPPASATTLTPSTVDADYYPRLPSPYSGKGSAFESVEELYLVKGILPDPSAGQALNATDPMYGYDTNHNGMLEDSENSGLANQMNAAQSGGMGFAHYVTVYSAEPNTSSTGTARVNINTGNVNQLTTVLQTALTGGRGTTVAQATARGRPYRNIFDYAQRMQLTPTEFAAVADLITTAAPIGGTNGAGGTVQGLININTAPAPVLACLPGLVDSDVQAIITKRASLTPTDMANVAWLATAISATKAAQIGGLVTARSFQYSADIVGVSGDGRAFKRERVIVDCQTSPPKILFRKDLTSLGWPLDPEIRTALRAGKPLPAGGLGNNMLKGGT